MSAAALALQKAVHAALTGDAALTALLGGPKVFDHMPPATTFPTVSFGRASVQDWSTATEPGWQVLFSLHAWSRNRGRSQVLAIMQAIRARLVDKALTVSGHHLVALTHIASETGFDDDAAVHFGTMRFRAVLEPAA